MRLMYSKRYYFTTKGTFKGYLKYGKEKKVSN